MDDKARADKLEQSLNSAAAALKAATEREEVMSERLHSAEQARDALRAERKKWVVELERLHDVREMVSENFAAERLGVDATTAAGDDIDYYTAEDVDAMLAFVHQRAKVFRELLGVGPA